jgi:hypothetical protein
VLSEGHISEADGPEAGFSAPEEAVSDVPEQALPVESPVNEEERDGEAEDERDRVHETPESKRIIQVMVLYDDDTFKTFMPAH